jgi:hypothetical protein
MAGDKIGVEMRQKYVLDLESVLSGKGGVLVRVALRVDDGGRARRLIPNHVRGVRQAGQIELFEDHLRSPSLWDRCFGGPRILRSSRPRHNELAGKISQIGKESPAHSCRITGRPLMQ